MRQGSLQTMLPTGTAVMQISPATCQLTRAVHLHPIRGPHDADQLPFGQYCAATYTGPLGNVFDAFDRFSSHNSYPNPNPLQGEGVGSGKLLFFFPDTVS